jgi:hypothetical protein
MQTLGISGGDDEPKISITLADSEIRREFDAWNERHLNSKALGIPPAQGRKFLAPAVQLLPVLDAFAELHPIAKGSVIFRLYLNTF